MFEDALKELDEAMADLKKNVDTVDVDREGFVRHVSKHLKVLKSETDEKLRGARLAYLAKCLEIAKNFEGPTAGAMTIPTFRDPGQWPTTDSPNGATPPAGAAPGSAPTSHGDDQQPASIPTPPSGGGNITPPPAGPSGAPFADGNFAKAIGAIEKMIEVLKEHATPDNGEPPKPDPKPKEDEKVTKGEEKKPDEVSKAAPVHFPTDMNDEDPDVDEMTFFGFDKGSELEKRYKAKKAAKAQPAAE
ncbi:MAG: hypothetical protein MI867_12015 [Pseudomonadales bacterium]|nr:hypothetical protein [Pseudomonadales bacterium]